MSAASFRRLSSFITDELGIKMCGTKLPMLQSRLMRRVRHLELASLDEYVKYLFDSPGGPAERVHFIDAVTTNKTEFFREPEHFEYLRQVLATSPNPGRHWNIWCAGCSTGEEAYSLAMTLQGHALCRSGFTFSVTATDVSTRVLKHAITAIYDDSAIGPIPSVDRERFLLRSRNPSNRVFRIVPELRSKVSFRRLNLMDPEFPFRAGFDVIFFRNVLIYFSRETQQAVIEKLCRTLAMGGHLFIGHSESLAGMMLPLRQSGPAMYTKVPSYANV